MMQRKATLLLGLAVPALLVTATVFALTAQADGSELAAHAGDDQTLECAGPDGATVTLDGTGSTAAENDTITRYEWLRDNETLGTGATLNVPLPLGEHGIVLRVTNTTNDTRIDGVRIHVIDTTAPTLTATASPDALWPPNHKLHSIDVAVSATDTCAGPVAWTLESTQSDEADDGRGDGHTANDAQGADTGTADASVVVRAERAGPGDGRSYTLTYLATDASGNSARETVLVRVPHDQGNDDEEGEGEGEGEE